MKMDEKLMVEPDKAMECICARIPSFAMNALQINETTIFKVAAALEEYTRLQIRNGEIEETLKCFEVVAELLEKEIATKAWENVYLYGINHLMDLKETPQSIKENYMRLFSEQHKQLINTHYP